MPFDSDIEMNSLTPTKVRSLGQGSSFTVRERPAETHNADSGSFSSTLQHFVDSFRRDSRASVDSGSHGGNGPGLAGGGPGSSHDHRGIRYYDLSSANAKTANTSLSRELKGRHLQMIAIGGSIGE
jgi:amino acid transporter